MLKQLFIFSRMNALLLYPSIRRCLQFFPHIGDLVKERAYIKSLCDEWNDYIGTSRNVVIEAKMWEEDMRVDSGTRTQELINDQLLKDIDIVMAMFGKTLGTPTKAFDSGTVEEISRHKKSFFIYFLDYKYTIDELDAGKMQKLKDLKEYLKKHGSFQNIKDKDDLRRKFYSSTAKPPPSGGG